MKKLAALISAFALASCYGPTNSAPPEIKARMNDVMKENWEKKGFTNVPLRTLSENFIILKDTTDMYAYARNDSLFIQKGKATQMSESAKDYAFDITEDPKYIGRKIKSEHSGHKGRKAAR